jgi:hypothetical protein
VVGKGIQAFGFHGKARWKKREIIHGRSAHTLDQMPRQTGADHSKTQTRSLVQIKEKKRRVRVEVRSTLTASD